MNQEFTSHRLTVNGIAKINEIKRGFDSLLNLVGATAPDNREFSIVRTKLEEACFFAVKAVSVEPENQEPSSREV